jgi:hypothetical protein
MKIIISVFATLPKAGLEENTKHMLKCSESLAYLQCRIGEKIRALRHQNLQKFPNVNPPVPIPDFSKSFKGLISFPYTIKTTRITKFIYA